MFQVFNLSIVSLCTEKETLVMFITDARQQIRLLVSGTGLGVAVEIGRLSHVLGIFQKL